MPRLLLYAFRYKSPVTGKWVKARYCAELQEIRHDHPEHELLDAEVREPRDQWASFKPYRKPGEREQSTVLNR
jgi:hypothetical protein